MSLFQLCFSIFLILCAFNLYNLSKSIKCKNLELKEKFLVNLKLKKSFKYSEDLTKTISKLDIQKFRESLYNTKNFIIFR